MNNFCYQSALFDLYEYFSKIGSLLLNWLTWKNANVSKRVHWGVSNIHKKGWLDSLKTQKVFTSLSVHFASFFCSLCPFFCFLMTSFGNRCSESSKVLLLKESYPVLQLLLDPSIAHFKRLVKIMLYIEVFSIANI